MKKRIAIVLIAIVVVVLGRGFFYYSGFYQAPPGQLPDYESIAVPAAPSTDFSDVYQQGEGIILIDLAHDNAFDKEELNVLILRLVSRGLTVRFLGAEDDLKRELLGKVEEEEPFGEEVEELLGEEVEELPGASAFIVVCPQLEFSLEEVLRDALA